MLQNLRLLFCAVGGATLAATAVAFYALPVVGPAVLIGLLLRA